MKTVSLPREHSNWSLKALQIRGTTRLPRKDQLDRWKKQILKGGSKFEKYEQINKWTYQKFCEARANKSPITTRNIQTWSLQCALQYVQFSLDFKASQSWVTSFKKILKINNPLRQTH